MHYTKIFQRAVALFLTGLFIFPLFLTANAQAAERILAVEPVEAIKIPETVQLKEVLDTSSVESKAIIEKLENPKEVTFKSLETDLAKLEKELVSTNSKADLVKLETQIDEAELSLTEIATVKKSEAKLAIGPVKPQPLQKRIRYIPSSFCNRFRWRFIRRICRKAVSFINRIIRYLNYINPSYIADRICRRVRPRFLRRWCRRAVRSIVTYILKYILRLY